MPLTRDWVEAAADLAVTASGGHRTGAACPPKQTGREETVRLIALHNRHRAGLPVAPPSILPPARSPTAPGPQVLAVRPRSLKYLDVDGRTGSGHPRLATPPRCQDVDPRIKSGDDGEGAGIAAVAIRD